MLFVRLENNQPVRMTQAAALDYLRRVLKVGVRDDPDPANLEPHGIFQLAETTKPTPGLDEVLTEGTPVNNAGTWTQVWTLTQRPVRASLSPRQWKNALERRGRWNAFKTWLAGKPPADQIEWHYSDIERSGPLIAALQADTGLTDAQLDAVFRV